MKDERDDQLNLSDFLDENAKQSEERRKKVENLIKNRATFHLEEFVKIYLKLMKRNSIELRRFFEQIFLTLRRMEGKEICFLKRMKNGRFRLFKRVYCCLQLEDWKKCPEYRCLIWPCDEDSDCPHDSTERELPLELKNAET